MEESGKTIDHVSTGNVIPVSLAEHSYCATLSDVVPPAGLVSSPISDLLLGPVTFPECDVTSVGLSIELGNVSEVGGFEDFCFEKKGQGLELETMWTGVGGGDHVYSKSTGNRMALEEEAPLMNEVSSKGRKYTRPRRRNFVGDPLARKELFEKNFRKLSMHLNRTMSRTGCGGELSAMFEGKIFNTARTADTSQCQTTPVAGVDLNSQLDEVSSVQFNHVDHQYAATMLTQNVSSSAVKDHQYSEKTIIADHHEFDDDDEQDLTEGKGSKNGRKRPDHYDFIKVYWRRDQTFASLAKSMFYQKALLEERTGAVVTLWLKYERRIFNENNHQKALTIIQSLRKAGGKAPSIILPKPGEVQTPLTFIVPNASGAPVSIPIHCRPANSHLTSEAPNNVSVLSLDLKALQEVSSSSGAVTFDSLTYASSSQATVKDTISLDFVNSSQQSDVVLLSDTADIGALSSLGSPSQFSPQPTSSNFSEFGEMMIFDNEQQRSPEPNITVARGMTDSSTNTEAVCSVCFSTNPANSNNNGGPTTAFWIRCNDPFCYDLVHAACLGFMVTCNAHLRQLPAYYCKVHR